MRGRAAGDTGLMTVSFAAGQPLGAMSSWGTFALVHHVCVQFCAKQANLGDGWYRGYALLGDDIVICHKPVADNYLRLMKALGVKINLQKSVVSNNCSLEFAKRFLYISVDASPISLRFSDAARASCLMSVSLYLSRLAEFRALRTSEIFRFYGAGFRVMGRLQGVWSIGYPKSKSRLSKRFWRQWLIIHSPMGLFPLPWLWWFSAGRGR